MALGFREIIWPLYVCLSLSIASVVFLIFAIATPLWIYEKVSHNVTYQGLWDICVEKETSICKGISQVKDTITASRIFLIIALFLLLLVIIFCLLRILVFKLNTLLFYCTEILLVIADVFTILGMIFYAFAVEDSDGKYSFSFAFSVISLSLTFLAWYVLLLELQCTMNTDLRKVPNPAGTSFKISSASEDLAKSRPQSRHRRKEDREGKEKRVTSNDSQIPCCVCSTQRIYDDESLDEPTDLDMDKRKKSDEIKEIIKETSNDQEAQVQSNDEDANKISTRETNTHKVMISTMKSPVNCDASTSRKATELSIKSDSNENMGETIFTNKSSSSSGKSKVITYQKTSNDSVSDIKDPQKGEGKMSTLKTRTKIYFLDTLWPLYACLIFSIASFVILILAVIVPFWIRSKHGQLTEYHGLWEICQKFGAGTSTCNSVYKFDTAALASTKVFLCVSLMVLMSAVVCCVLRILAYRLNTLLFYCIVTLLGTSAVFTMIGVVLYTVVAKDIKGYYNFAFFLGIVSIITTCIGMSLLMLELRCRQELNESDYMKPEEHDSSGGGSNAGHSTENNAGEDNKLGNDP